MVQKEVFIIAGPNGAGKTTFSVNMIDDGWIEHFVNADEIAKEYAHLPVNKANVLASRVFLKTLDRLAKQNESFAFETTLSGRSHLKRIKALQNDGWLVSLFYLVVSSPDISKDRVAERVAHGGHNIPESDIYRRYPKSLRHFYNDFLPIVDYAECVFNEGNDPTTIFRSFKGELFDQHPELCPQFFKMLENVCKT